MVVTDCDLMDFSS